MRLSAIAAVAFFMKSFGRSTLLVGASTAAWFLPLQSPALAKQTGSHKAQSFPTKFRGDWYNAPGPCDRNPDRLALHIGSKSLNYFDEFSGRLSHVIRQTDRIVHYRAEYSAEGHRSDSVETLRLSPKGNVMTIQPGRTSSRYFRCTINAAR